MLPFHQNGVVVDPSPLLVGCFWPWPTRSHILIPTNQLDIHSTDFIGCRRVVARELTNLIVVLACPHMRIANASLSCPSIFDN